ncbi:MAG: bifunctional [glutamine synthetase] adenylyltransferase/[glutamine synthetase]-adenylyl-L-tyrosine phosphorylase [Emcibacter sp.]|nr:bifunctional [glutamine synthetase] adenylyltransferase/[glutamine synthetase]-adenylyl-L-tyrosine phosphorylase [Emcibacter sp.]
MTSNCSHFPLAQDNKSGEDKLTDFMTICREQQVTDIEELINKKDNRNLLQAIFSDSPYLSQLLLRNIDFCHDLFSKSFDILFSQLIEDLTEKLPLIDDSSHFGKILRKAKAKMALIISFADLSGEWPLKMITQRLTEFAEISVSFTVSHLLRREMVKGNLAVPDHFKDIPSDQLKATPDISKDTGYVVLAMGKMGGYELNYSSDIDLIVLYDNDIVRYTGRKSAQDMFIKLTQNLVKIIQERTSEGYVFRTDLRLRPDPGATAVALSMEGAEVYYQSMGLNWERAAMIKARPVAGDIKAGYDFLSRIKGFVWRKHLDYAALEDIYSIKKLIHQHHGHQPIAFAGQDIKLGHGGIREIEFYAQIFQLISGGREPDLRIAPTCDALNALVKAQKISEADNKKLQTAYVYLRTLEHRLQMINDDQTHSMPESEGDLKRITRFMGYQNRIDFEDVLSQYLHNVHSLFTDLLKEAHQDDDDNEQLLAFPSGHYNHNTLEVIKNNGYNDPKAIYDIILTWNLGRYRACRTERARKLLQSFIPDILSNFARSGKPDRSFRRFDEFLSRLPSGIQLFSFIKAHPWLLELLSEIISVAPYLSDQLAKRPLLLDAVLNNDFFKNSFTTKHLSDHLEGLLTVAKDFQDILDITRKWASEHKFQVGVHILQNKIDSKTAGRNLSLLADVILNVMLKKVEEEFAQKHGKFEHAQMVVLGLGKFGGQELTSTSDLDLVFIYEVGHEAVLSDGNKPLTINHYFSRLSQQFINSLTAMTSEGKLYEIDMRLRPSGNAGPIAITLNSFAEYQKNTAWNWEHLALTRGRVIVGSDDLSHKITTIINQALCNEIRDQNKLLQDVFSMREKLRAEFGSEDIWSIKHTRGGLVDIEFICQYLLLKHAAQYPEILVTNTLDQILQLKKFAILSDKMADEMYADCYFMQDVQVILRLCMGSNVKFNHISHENYLGLIDTLCIRFSVKSINQLAKKLTKTQNNIYKIYQQIIEYPAHTL